MDLVAPVSMLVAVTVAPETGPDAPLTSPTYIAIHVTLAKCSHTSNKQGKESNQAGKAGPRIIVLIHKKLPQFLLVQLMQESHTCTLIFLLTDTSGFQYNKNWLRTTKPVFRTLKFLPVIQYPKQRFQIVQN